MRILPVFLALLLSLGLQAAAPADFTPHLVKDINRTVSPANSRPDGFFALGNLVLFQASRLFGHSELWRSDGTASGTYRLLDTSGYWANLAVTGDRLFFRLEADDARWYLWVTDGTLPGTFSLGETSGGYEEPAAAWVPSQGVLYFASEIPGQGHGKELWRSDGTPGGTYEVLDVEPGPGSSNPTGLTDFQGRLYFAAGCALWQSDGTAAGTVKVRDVCADSLRVVGSRLVFVGADSHGSELWASDGTAAGTRRISDLAKGAGSPDFHAFQVVGKRLFFTATASAARGDELYVTDGTAQGTQRLTWFSDPDALDFSLVAMGDRLLFVANDSTHGEELWSSDGTPKGTRMVVDACPGVCSSSLSYRDLSSGLQHRGRLYYQGRDGTHGFELWVTDGTAQGTHMVKDLCPGGCDSSTRTLGTSGERVFFAAWDDTACCIESLWTTDGTADGTVKLAEIYDADVYGTAAGGVLIFSGSDPDHGSELWSSDGTRGGTHLLVDIADEDLGGSHPRGLMTLGESVLFFAREDEEGRRALWRSDGTDAGTTVVNRSLNDLNRWTGSATRVFFETQKYQGSSDLWTSDGSEAGTIKVTPDGVYSLGELSAPVIKLGSRVFFSAWSEKHGAEPWITDGTRAGTRLVADLRPGPAHSSPRDFTVFAGRAWFVARFRLWKSDGTAKGTVALGPELRDIHPRTTYGGRLWFTGRNSGGRTELWDTEGTAAKTVRIAELQTIESLTVHAGRLWFLGNGSELWSTDGTTAGTRKLDLPASSTDKPFQFLLSDGIRLYVSGYGKGLWVSDGTAAGTRKISDQGYDYGAWTAFAGRLYYNASRNLYTSDGTEAGTHSVRPDSEPIGASRLLRFGDRLVAFTDAGEIWQSDGTAAGTKRIFDMSPFSYNWEVVKAGPRLFFPAWNEETGWELWAIRE